MPKLPKNRTKPRQGEGERLTWLQKKILLFDFEFKLNIPFRTDGERQACWERHREELMAEYAREGFRPGAWWAFDSGIPLDQLPRLTFRGNNPGKEGPFVAELEYLMEIGQASPEELALYEEEKKLPPEPGQVET